MNTEADKNIEPAGKVHFSLNRRVLLGFVSAVALLFLVLNRTANGFFPDARLYPYVMTLIGLVFAGFSLFRIVTGREPVFEAHSTGQNDDHSHEEWLPYRKAGFYLGLILAFYVGVWLLGFRLAAVIFVFGFIRYNGQSLVISGIYAIAGLALVEFLSRILQLVLPSGFF